MSPSNQYIDTYHRPQQRAMARAAKSRGAVAKKATKKSTTIKSSSSATNVVNGGRAVANYLAVNMFNCLVAVGGPVDILATHSQDLLCMLVNSIILLPNLLRIWEWWNRRNDTHDNNNGNDNNRNDNNRNDGRMEKPPFYPAPFFYTIQECFRLLYLLQWISMRIVDKDYEPPHQRHYSYIPGLSFRYHLRPIANVLYDMKQWVVHFPYYHMLARFLAFYAGFERGSWTRMTIVVLEIVFIGDMEDSED